jgi:hypothetical protein
MKLATVCVVWECFDDEEIVRGCWPLDPGSWKLSQQQTTNGFIGLASSINVQPQHLGIRNWILL